MEVAFSIRGAIIEDIRAAILQDPAAGVTDGDLRATPKRDLHLRIDTAAVLHLVM